MPLKKELGAFASLIPIISLAPHTFALFVGRDDGTVCALDPHSLRELRVLVGQHTSSVQAMTLCGDDLYSASSAVVLTRARALCKHNLVLSLPIRDLDNGR